MADVNKVTNLISIIKQTDQQFLDPKGIMLKDILDATGASAQELFDILNGGKEVEGSVSKAVNDAVIALVDGSPEQLDTLKEISDALQGDAASTATLLKAIADNAAASNQKHDVYAKATEDARIAEAAKIEDERAERAAELAAELKKGQQEQDDKHDAYVEATETARVELAAEVEDARVAEAAKVEDARVELAAEVEDARAERAAQLADELKKSQQEQDDKHDAYAEATETARVELAAEVEDARIKEAARVEDARLVMAAAVAKEESEYRATIDTDQREQDDKHKELKTSHESLDNFVRTNLDLDLDGDGAYDKLSEFLTFVNEAQANDAESIAKAVKDASDANVELEERVNASLDTTNSTVASNKKESDEALTQVNSLIVENHTAALEATATVQENLNTAELTLNSKITDVNDSLDTYKGEQEEAAKAIAEATQIHRDADADYKTQLNTSRAEEAKEYSEFKENDTLWKTDMTKLFDDEKKFTAKDREELRSSINNMVNDQNADAINSIEEIINHVTDVTNTNVSEIYAKNVSFVAVGGIVTPDELIWEGTFSAKINGVEVYEGDYTPKYEGGRLVSFELVGGAFEMYQSGAKLSISGRVGELKAYSWNLDLPFSS